MKKIIAIIIAVAGLALAGEFAVTKTITATKFCFDRLMVDVSRPEPTFTISGRYVDDNGKTVEPKTIRCNLEQARQIMPQIDLILSNATAAISANITNLLAQ